MKTRLFATLLLYVISCVTILADEGLARREWKVDGVLREALIHIPTTAKTNAAPVVFAFHGHGGSMRNASRMFGYHSIWPEAIVVYMQGLNTPGQLTDPEGKKPGWQKTIGDQGDRDLKFFDAVMKTLKKEYKVDSNRIYSTGHSNGGGFTYLLWAARGEQFAAFAPSAAVGRTLIENDPAFARELLRRRAGNNDGTSDSNSAATDRKFIPKPVLHVAGTNDPLVKFEWQKLMISALRKLNQCDEGKPWDMEKNHGTLYESKVNAPVVTYVTAGTHKFPDEAPALIVKFFKEHAKPSNNKKQQ